MATHQTAAISQRPRPGARADLAFFAREMAKLLGPEIQSERTASAATPPVARLLAGMKEAQALRLASLPAACFSNTNWIMIVELMLAALEGRRMAVSSLGAQTGIPYTTALNRIRALIAQDVFRATPDPLDRRRTYVELSPDVAARVEAYLQRIVGAPED